MKTKTSKQAKTQPAQDQTSSHPYIGVIGYLGEMITDFSQHLVKSVKGKKRVIMALIVTGFGISTIQAQTAGTYLVGESKHEVVLKTATGQYGDGNEQTQAPVKKAQQGVAINSPVAHNIIGEDKYLKTKEADKKYTEFEVYDIKGLNKDQVVLGMLTNTLDRATRYNQVGGNEQKAEITTAYINKLDDKGQVVKDGGKVPVSTFRFKDKVFVIIGDDDYRYMDGAKLVGDQKVVNELMKGKPITEVTFFYELQKAGIVSKFMTPTKFAELSISEKQRLVNKGIMAGNL